MHQQQSGSSAVSGRTSYAGGARTSHAGGINAGGGVIPGQAHGGLPSNNVGVGRTSHAGVASSGPRSLLDSQDLLSALPGNRMVGNRDARNAPVFISAGQISLNLPEGHVGQPFTNGASDAITSQVRSSIQTLWSMHPMCIHECIKVYSVVIHKGISTHCSYDRATMISSPDGLSCFLSPPSGPR